MNKASFDSSLLEQLGLTNWHMHTRFSHSDVLAQEAIQETQPLSAEAESALEQTEFYSEENSLHETLVVQEEAAAMDGVQAVNKVALVIVGLGLEQVWQNEENPAWRLMLNILNALDLQEDDVLYFDTGLLHTEDAIWMTLEEIIETGVEVVFSFDQESMLNEALAEGLQVEVLPSLDEMLQQGYAKKQTYYRLASHVH